MPKDFRLHRIADLIRKTLSEMLLEKTEDNRFHEVSVTRVIVSRDLNHAKVYVSMLSDEHIKETVAALNRAAKFFRYNLAHIIKLRVTPELRFYYDDSYAKGERIALLLNKALRDTDKEKDK